MNHCPGTSDYRIPRSMFPCFSLKPGRFEHARSVHIRCRRRSVGGGGGGWDVFREDDGTRAGGNAAGGVPVKGYRGRAEAAGINAYDDGMML